MDKNETSRSALAIWILAPCFYDAQSFVTLRQRAQEHVLKAFPDAELTFVLVDDSGGQDAQVQSLKSTSDLVILTAPYNLGHQGAIIYGLRSLASFVEDDDYVVTADSDGEDCPEDIPKLLEPLLVKSDNLCMVSLAQRTKRNESLAFKLLYACFKIFFRTLTGTLVRNGNFAAFRGWFVRHVAFHPAFDYCYSSSLLAVPLSRESVPLSRGSRYYGQSKMTMLSLVSHGFRMLMPFAERIAIRVIMVSALLLLSGVVMCLVYLAQLTIGLHRTPFTLMIGICIGTFALSMAACACIFFQVSSQTKAISLRDLTCKPPADKLPTA